MKTFNSGVTIRGDMGLTLENITPSFTWNWAPVAIAAGSLPGGSYLYGWRTQSPGSDTEGGGELLYMGEFNSSPTQSGGIPNNAFAWPVSNCLATWEITAYDTGNRIWYMKLTNVVSATSWGGIVNYQAIAQPNSSGSGYQTAVLAEMCQKVYSIERIKGLAQKAQRLLEQLGYHNFQIQVDDGTRGWPEKAPFHGIVVSASSPQIPASLCEQLEEGGRMIIPVGTEKSQILRFVYKKNGQIFEDDKLHCTFVKLIGEYGWNE
jgi:protein-L-isoaspartate(D-aspartate) O-methyltransferase